MNPELARILQAQLDAARAALSGLPEEQRGSMALRIQHLIERLSENPTSPSTTFTTDTHASTPAVGAAGDKFLTYRGDIRAIVGVGGSLAFVTVHPEGQPTALYRLNTDSLKLTEQPLPCGGLAIAASGNTVFVGGTDKRLYVSDNSGSPEPRGTPFPGDISAIVPVSNDRLAIVAGTTLTVVSRTNGEVLQSLELPETGTCAATDKTGQWLAVGAEKGTVAVFDGQDKPEFEPAESDRLHDGAVTAILFEPEELRFFSAGADHKLLSTHARGRLEPEDKGRDNSHEDAITGMVWAPGVDRFLTGGRDSVLKSWPRVGGVKPASLKDGIAKVVAISVVTAYNRSRLAVCCADNSLRFVELDAEGRFGASPARVFGAVDRIRSELGYANDFKRREKALKELAGWNDTTSLELTAKQMEQDGDHQLRLLAAQLIVGSSHPKAAGFLEPAVNHRDEKVRVEAFHGLRTKRGLTDLGPIDLALKSGKSDVGVLAVQALEPLAKKDDQALARLTGALDHAAWDVRKSVLVALASVFAADLPVAGLTALQSKHGDIRAASLAWFHERSLLADPRVLSATRRRLEDDDANVRRVAFLVSVLARKSVSNYLRRNDPELHRQLNELQGTDSPIEQVPESNKARLTPDDYDIPLQATAARALDTCLRGARALAVLGDPRAFGLLLQLSREDVASARVDVCRALAALNDPRSVARLRSLLYDSDASVRDAAYSALAKIQSVDPLAAASSGLTATAEDVRRRGLQTLVETLRKSPTPAATDLLTLALNDAAVGVRSEAWKAALNLKIGGGGEPTLRFAKKSVHPDIRREVLIELTAQLAEPWATPLLYEFLNDPDSGLRTEAFDHATRKTKELTPLEAALGSRYTDTRRLAIDALIKKRTKAAQSLLLKSLHDPDRDLRQLALGSLVDDEALPALREAAANEFPDVRVRAAASLANSGDSAALKPLLELATAEEPTERERQSTWQTNAEAALNGLAELGDPAAVEPVQWLVAGKHPRLRAAAAWVLAYSTGPAAIPALRSALSHSDRSVRGAAVFGLAIRAQSDVLSQLLSEDFTAEVGAKQALTAAFAIGSPGERLAATYLDHADDAVRRRAVLVHLLLELHDPAGTADRLLECLSAKAPRTRLLGAQGLELYTDPAAFRDFVGKTVNDRGDETDWKIPPETIDSVAAVLAAGASQLQARLFDVLATFDEKDQAGWNAAWDKFAKRFVAEIATASAKQKRTTSKLTIAQLRELAFGAYVGLVREQGLTTATPAVVRVRQTALSRVFALASTDTGYARSAQPVLTQALSDPNQPVRTQAFEHLLALGTDKTWLGAEALEAGFTDLAVKGLELLSAGAADGDAVLERVALGRTDNLATEAAKLLMARRGVVPVATTCLEAVSESLRQQGVQWLAAEYEKSPAARDALRSALGSRYRKLRETVTFELAQKKDPAAFDALVQLLRDSEFRKKQGKVIEALAGLNDSRSADALISRIENDPAGTADVVTLLEAAASCRQPELADRVLAIADRKKDWRLPAFSAVQTISGFDQHIEDAEDEQPDRKWELEQHPRHPMVLAKLMAKSLAVGTEDFAVELIPAARWCRGSDVNESLTLLATNPTEAIRTSALEAIGWRFKHRSGPVEPLLKALRHPDPTTQFLAAEGLARGGRPEGINVLLSAIEYLEDVSLRERAVLALGELGDVRAVDVLLRFASEDGHALQEVAAEAVGHLRRSPGADKIGIVLERLAQGSAGVAQRAMIGLRWFNTVTGWKLIRQRATDPRNWVIRKIAAEQLGFHDDPATRDLLAKLLRTESDTDVLQAAFRSARRVWGQDSLEPYFAVLVHPDAAEFATDEDDFGEDVVKAVCMRGNVLAILDVFPRCSAEIQGPLEASLLSRPEVPVKEATAGLSSEDAGTVRLAARLLARAGSSDVAVKKAVPVALTKWLAAWQERRAKWERDSRQWDALERATDALRALCWAASRTGAGLDQLAELAITRPEDAQFKRVRAEAVRCLATVPPTASVLKVLDAVARGFDPDTREIAADILARHDTKRATALVESLASDRPSFTQLAGKPGIAATFVKVSVGQVHYQPVALPTLITLKDVDALATVAKNRKASEAVRLGAIEGLGAMAFEQAECVLAEVGATDGDDDDVRKAAWRALRRSKRARKTQQTRTAANAAK